MPEAGANGLRLEVLARLAAEAGAAYVASDIRALSDRVRDGLFFVACVGQFKRGKSTLLNALVGAPVLPVGVVPVTAVVTVVRHGPSLAARVKFADDAWRDIPPEELATYVTEERNPENSKGVAAAEVFVPSSLLSNGMCLVDTPGISSVFGGNTEATRAFVPHIDAALVVLGADPPLSADELSLVSQIAAQCPDLIFVLNKADKLNEAERKEAKRFTREILAKRAGLKNVALFEVSAKTRLAGTGGDAGWDGLNAALETLARESGASLAKAAEERGLALVSGHLARHLEEQREALLRPVEESERRIEALRACVGEAERSLNDLGYLFAAEIDRLARIFEERKEEFLRRARPEAMRELAEFLSSSPRRFGPAIRDAATEKAHEITRRWLDRWLSEAQPAAEALYVEATRRFVDLANGFLEHAAASGDPALGALPRTLRPETGFRVRSRLYFTSLMALTGQTPIGWFLDLVRPHGRQVRAVERQVGEYLDRLMTANANRIVSDFIERVMESRWRFQSEIRASLKSVASSADAALARAKECRAQGSRAVETEIERINNLETRLKVLGLQRRGAGP
jgi:GTP-binding protein EngB required for normal cell division